VSFTGSVSSNRLIKVAVCTPQVLFREGLREFLRQQHDMRVLDAPLAAEKLPVWAQLAQPDVILQEVSPFSTTGLELLLQVKRECQAKAIMLLEHWSEDFVVRAVHWGVDGYVLTTANPQDFVGAVHAVYAGGLWIGRRVFVRLVNGASPVEEALPAAHPSLTRRELQIVELVSLGLRNRDVAERLRIGEATVKAHLNTAFKKLGVRHRMQLLGKTAHIAEKGNGKPAM
jgi:DNA-binding NarL/FixJ family response regulator